MAIRRRRRRRNDNLSIVLMLIVAVFLICNLPRLILNMHEITVIQDVNRCQDTDLGGFPVWSIALGFVSHILLVFNSSTNLFIYCMVGAKFRSVFYRHIMHRKKVGACPCIGCEVSKCPMCGRRGLELRTVQKSEEEAHCKENANGKFEVE